MIKLKNIIHEGLGQDPDYDFAMGKKVGIKDKMSDTKRDLSQYSADFIKGYKLVQRESTWDRINAALTNRLAALGSSLIRR